MNFAAITGNIVREPVFRATTDGTPVCSFTVAVNRNYKDSTGLYPADFINCVAWRDKADFVHKYFSKGSAILVTGETWTRSYVTKSGDKRHISEIVVKNVEFFSTKYKDNQPADIKPETVNELDEFADFAPADDADLPF